MHKISFIILLFLSCQLSAQEKSIVYFHIDKKSERYVKLNDSIEDVKFKIKAVTTFKLLGYVGVQIIDTTKKKNKTHYWLSYKYRYKKVELKNVDKSKITTINQVELSIDKQLISLENTGFPFAKINIVNQSIEGKSLVLNYKIDSGQFIIIDKIHIKSEDKFNIKTIHNLIDLKVGQPYNEGKLLNISRIISSSDLYKLIRQPKVIFRKGKAEVYIYLKKKKSSAADGYIGLLQDKTSQKLSVNGFINLQLKNALNRGELLNLNWKSNPDKTQNLKMNFKFPYIFNLPIEIESNVNLQKQDTTFVRADVDYGISFIQPFFKIGLYNQLISSTVLTKTNLLIIKEFKKNIIGINIEFKPKLIKGFDFYEPKIKIKSGFFSYKSDSLQTKTTSSNYTYRINFIQKIKFLNYFSYNNNTGFSGLNSSYKASRNELVYYGGLKSVRGFYELELTGNEVFTVLNEIEYQPISILSFKVIYDYSQFRYNNAKNFTNSIGVGFGLINKSSILEIIIANGVLNNNQTSFNNTKIHIGFKASF